MYLGVSSGFPSFRRFENMISLSATFNLSSADRQHAISSHKQDEDSDDGHFREQMKVRRNKNAGSDWLKEIWPASSTQYLSVFKVTVALKRNLLFLFCLRYPLDCMIDFINLNVFSDKRQCTNDRVRLNCAWMTDIIFILNKRINLPYHLNQ